MPVGSAEIRVSDVMRLRSPLVLSAGYALHFLLAVGTLSYMAPEQIRSSRAVEELGPRPVSTPPRTMLGLLTLDLEGGLLRRFGQDARSARSSRAASNATMTSA